MDRRLVAELTHAPRDDMPPSHEKIVARLAQILGMLNEGQSLDPVELSQKFGVTLRTIQRDLNERFGYLDLQKVEGRYRLNAARAQLGVLTTSDLAQFAALAGVREMFPGLTTEFLREIFDSRVQAALLIRGHEHETLPDHHRSFRQLEKAIVAQHRVRFDFVKGDSRKGYDGIEPYKLVNHRGIWYLAAKDGSKLKTFSLACIDRVMVTEGATFDLDPTVQQRLVDADGIWVGDELEHVVLTVSSEAAPYFRRRKLLANQAIEQELADGGLIVSAKVGHANQILPAVRHWIPHLRIVSPDTLRLQLERSLTDYLAP